MTELEYEPRQPPLKKAQLHEPARDSCDQTLVSISVAPTDLASTFETSTESGEDTIMRKKTLRQLVRDRSQPQDTPVKDEERKVHNSRRYQFEMLEESMQRNIIIAVGDLHSPRLLPVYSIELPQDPPGTFFFYYSFPGHARLYLNVGRSQSC